MTDSKLPDLEVRLRRTSCVRSHAPSCVGLRPTCMVFPNKVGSLDPPFLFEEKVSPKSDNEAYKVQIKVFELTFSFFPGQQ